LLPLDQIGQARLAIGAFQLLLRGIAQLLEPIERRTAARTYAG
jgi:hypothetical protein